MPVRFSLFLDIDCDMLKKVTFSSNAKSIGVSAFRNCTGITEIILPNSITSIGSYAFSATSISSIVLPDGVELDIDNTYIFEGCSKLTDVTLPSTLKTIPSYTFTNCSQLSKLDIPASVTNLGVIFISGTSIESIVLPNSITNIHSHTFNGCESLKNISFPTQLKSIEYNAFENCINLKNIELPSTLQSIDKEAFKGCTSLESIIIPNSVTTLNTSAFENCTSLSNVKLPQNITEIKGGLFSGCTSLKNIELSNTVKAIGGAAFEGSGLISITIPQSVTSIGTHVFASCKSLKSVTFSSDSTPLSNYMFLDATSLESIAIPKNITIIPIGFCSGATSLTTIQFNEGLISIQEEAFSKCTSLKTVTMPTTLRIIFQKAFKGCTDLVSVDFSNINIVNENAGIAQECFANCTSLTEIKNFDRVNCMNETFFANTPLQKTENGMVIAAGWLLEVYPAEIPTILSVPQGVTKIVDYAFSACTHIEEVILPEGLTYIGTRIFGTNNLSLRKLTIPDSLTTFPTDTISFLNNMQELVVGKGLQSFEHGRLGNLPTIRFRGTIEEFYQMPWCNNDYIKEITIICDNGTIAPEADI